MFLNNLSGEGLFDRRPTTPMSLGRFVLRSEKGRFRWPEADKMRSVTMRAEELAMLLNGLDLKQTKPRAWYRKSA